MFIKMHQGPMGVVHLWPHAVGSRSNGQLYSWSDLVPVVMAAAVWGHQWQGCHVCFHSDNMAVVSVLVNRAAKDERMNHLLRTLFFYAAYYKFHFSAEHVPGVLNVAADALSQDNVTLFSHLVPQVPQVSIPVPVLDLLLQEPPDWSSAHWTTLFRRSLLRE